MNESIEKLKRQLRGIDAYLHMLNTKDRSDSVAMVSPAHSKLTMTLCWQQSAGSKNYHESSEQEFNTFLIRSICTNAKLLLEDAKRMCIEEFNAAKIARKQELQSELREIEEFERERAGGAK